MNNSGLQQYARLLLDGKNYNGRCRKVGKFEKFSDEKRRAIAAEFRRMRDENDARPWRDRINVQQTLAARHGCSETRIIIIAREFGQLPKRDGRAGERSR